MGIKSERANMAKKKQTGVKKSRTSKLSVSVNAQGDFVLRVIHVWVQLCALFGVVALIIMGDRFVSSLGEGLVHTAVFLFFAFVYVFSAVGYQLRISKEKIYIEKVLGPITRILREAEISELAEVVFTPRQFETRIQQAIFSKGKVKPEVKRIRLVQAEQTFDIPINISRKEAQWVESELEMATGLSVRWEENQ